MLDFRFGRPGLPRARFSVVALALALLSAAAGGGCGRGEVPSPDAPPEAPRRIVSLTPSLTEILFALGLGDRVVGVTSFCDYPPEARQLARVGGYVNPSVEAIVALAPDLVVVSPNAGNRDAALAAQRAGAPLVVIRAESLDDTYRAIEETARVCGVPDRGAELARSVRERVQAAVSRVRGRDPVPVLFSLQLEPIIAAGRDTLPAALLELAGGINIVDSAGYPRLGIETVIDAAPQVILQARMDTPEPDADDRVRAYWRRWPSIPAVRDGRVFVFDGSTALRPGPRVADAVRLLAGMLHPEPATAGEREAP